MEVQHFKVVKFQTAVGLKKIWKILLFEWRKKAKYLNISIRKVEEFKRLKILKYEKWEKYKALDNKRITISKSFWKYGNMNGRHRVFFLMVASLFVPCYKVSLCSSQYFCKTSFTKGFRSMREKKRTEFKQS